MKGGGGGGGEGRELAVAVARLWLQSVCFVSHNLAGFQFLQRSQMIEYFVGAQFHFLIT